MDVESWDIIGMPCCATAIGPAQSVSPVSAKATGVTGCARLSACIVIPTKATTPDPSDQASAAPRARGEKQSVAYDLGGGVSVVSGGETGAAMVRGVGATELRVSSVVALSPVGASVGEHDAMAPQQLAETGK